MRIAIVADCFPPKNSSGSLQLLDLASEFARQGHHVTAIISDAEIKKPWIVECLNDVVVLRLRAPRLSNFGYLGRVIGELLMPYFMLLNISFSPLKKNKYEAVIWYSPTIFLGPLIKILKKRSNCPSYLIVRDIFPEWAWEIGIIRSKLVYLFLRHFANYQNKQANVIGLQTPGNLCYFDQKKQKSYSAKIEVLHNWLSSSQNIGCSINIDKTKLSGRKIFIYAGNIGVAQNIEIFCQLAHMFRKNLEFGFMFVGRGSESARLFKKYGHLPNVMFFDEVPANEIPGLYAQCHIGLISLDYRHKSHNIPGKFLSYMNAGLPVLAYVNKGNDIVNLIRTNGVGVVVEGGSGNDKDQLFEAIISMAAKLGHAEAIRCRCKYLATTMFSSEKASRQILSALSQIH